MVLSYCALCACGGQPFPGMSLLEVCLKHACRILIAVNEDPHYHFTVLCDATDSVNVLSTRGALCTVDCIPPMHRCVKCRVPWLATIPVFFTSQASGDVDDSAGSQSILQGLHED